MKKELPKFDKEQFTEILKKSLNGPGRIKLKDLKKRGSGKKNGRQGK